MRRLVLRVRLRRGWIALAACALAGAALLLVTGVSSASFEASRGDAYTCEFAGIVGNITPPLGDPLHATTTGTWDMVANTTCVFTDAADPTKTTSFNGEIDSAGTYHNALCQIIELKADSAYGATTFSGGPEGPITGSGSNLFFIELQSQGGEMDIGNGLTEADGDALQPMNPAGAVFWDARNTGGCVTNPAPALNIAGSFAAAT